MKVVQPPMIELNIIIDKCAGQNKNCMVICTAPCMTDSGLFENVNLMFHQRSHQKVNQNQERMRYCRSTNLPSKSPTKYYSKSWIF